MPELPEVETVVRDLRSLIRGQRLKKIEIKKDFHKKISPLPVKFIKLLVGLKLLDIERTGKMITFDFGEDKKVHAHMKMTGQFVFRGRGGREVFGGHPISDYERFTKVIFDFGASGKLYYNDIRKFGYFKILSEGASREEKSKYGLEPIDPKFTLRVFRDLLARRPNLEIKKFLLMQEFISGIGNIYADEACFAAGILPTRKIKDLSKLKQKKLYETLKSILKKAIKYRGTSVNTYVDALGVRGSYVKFLKVYGRAGQRCLKCARATIKKTRCAGRGTSFCPICQK